MHAVELDNQPRKFLKKAEHLLAERITEKLKSLRVCPVPHDAKYFENQGVWRVRVGDYRILYYIKHEQKQIIIARIDHRSRIY